MRKILIILALMVLMALPQAAQAAAPRSLAGFTLGDSVAKHKNMLITGSAATMHDEPYLSEVDVKHYVIPEISDGTLVFGTCADPYKIIRIKLRLTNNTREYFDKLFTLYKKRFGEPDVWRGDAFHNRIFWKWSFKEPDGTNISVFLGHSRDPDDKPGNSIKLTFRSAWEAEMKCYQKTHGQKKQGQPPQPASPGSIDKLVPH